ncbi:IS110 family transposase, partial [Ascidiaceihabitans sp.]|uniref:IS110 family transposase n=1 Tax=Ascidiaceihabitans sp. TaxID=1872644 RepID=UPI0032978250
MEELHIIGVDLAKRVFQVHGSDRAGHVLFRKKLSRLQFKKFLFEIPSCTIAMEACATSHNWGREAQEAGHIVRLIPPSYVKPFVKRHKNDAVDAEAIVEAALRPSMSFVAVKTKEQQAQAVMFRSRDLYLRQRTQLINAMHGHLAEYGVLLPSSRASVARMVAMARERSEDLPASVFEMVVLMADDIERLTIKVATIDKALKKLAQASPEAKRLRTMPGVGPITAVAIQAFCPAADNFDSGRGFAAWLGLVPRQNSTGGKDRFGRITKMGQRDVRRLLVTGAMSVISASERKGRCDDPWLANMLKKKPRLVA